MNYLAIAVAAAFYMVLGALWYSPLMFCNVWCNSIGKTKEEVEQKSSLFNYLWATILSFLAAYGIARVNYWVGADSLATTLKVSLLLGVCFVLTTMGVNDIFEARPRSLTLVNIFYHIVGFVVMGIVIGLWQ